MLVRKYRDCGSSNKVAGIIGSEVIESGKSDGWQGSLEELSQVEKILSEFNIFYVDDFAGEWRLRAPKRGWAKGGLGRALLTHEQVQ